MFDFDTRQKIAQIAHSTFNGKKTIKVFKSITNGRDARISTTSEKYAPKGYGLVCETKPNMTKDEKKIFNFFARCIDNSWFKVEIL